MANVRLAVASQQAGIDAIVDRIDGGTGAGKIKIYAGTQPANGNASATETLLAELTFSDPAFGAGSTAGVATASSITDDSSANATGTAAWARIVTSSTANVFDCDVGNSTASTIALNATAITSGGTVSLTSFTMRLPSGV